VTENGQCLQAVPIAKLEVTTEQIGKTLEKLGNVLEKIAEQGEKVRSLEDNQELLFGRIRGVELTAAKEETKIGFIVAGIAAIISMLTTITVKFFDK